MSSFPSIKLMPKEEKVVVRFSFAAMCAAESFR